METHPLHRRRMDFLELKHKKGDSIEELAAEVVDHVNEADLPRMSTEDWYLFGILEKCNDKTFKEKILDEGSNMTYKRMMSKLKVYNESRAIMKKDHINVNKVDGQMPNRGCWKCGKEDHRRDSCKERVFCSNCQSQNHATKICRSGGNRPGTPHTRGSRGNTRGSTRGNTRGRGNTRSRQQIRANMAKLQETLDLQQAELDEIESEPPKADEEVEKVISEIADQTVNSIMGKRIMVQHKEDEEFQLLMDFVEELKMDCRPVKGNTVKVDEIETVSISKVHTREDEMRCFMQKKKMDQGCRH